MVLQKSCLVLENNQLKCGDYLLLFSMRTDDDEQHFNWPWPDFLIVQCELYYTHYFSKFLVTTLVLSSCVISHDSLIVAFVTIA